MNSTSRSNTSLHETDIFSSICENLRAGTNSILKGILHTKRFGRTYFGRKSGGIKVQGKYRVITLCGSTRFKEEFMKAQKRLTLEGNIVISVGLFGHSGDDEVWTEGTKEMLDDMHKRKIDMADEIFVINVRGYIGSSTRSEIEYAKDNGKTVKYLEPIE